MARLLVFSVIVVLGVGAGLVLISERSAATRVGYQIAELEGRRRQLVDQNRQLEARVAQLKTANHIAERAKSLHLEVVPPEACLEARAAAEPHPKDGAPR
jgi:cell division protein FtsB